MCLIISLNKRFILIKKFPTFIHEQQNDLKKINKIVRITKMKELRMKKVELYIWCVEIIIIIIIKNKYI